MPQPIRDTHYLVTVSNNGGTRHFRVPKRLKSIAIGTSLVVGLTLIGVNLVVFNQKDQLNESITKAHSLEDTLVKLSARNSNLNKTLTLSSTEESLVSEVIAQMEQISGVNTGAYTSVLDRLTALSNHFINKELDFDALDGGSIKQKKTLSLNLAPIEPAETTKDQIESTSLNVSHLNVLHDSIPNGYPTRNVGVTSSFGKRQHPTTKQASFHNGIDLPASSGTRIYATADGVIKNAEKTKLSGNRIIVAHNYGFESRYAHLSEMSVKAGDIVQKGDIIGLSGNTGRTDGPHLHYEVRHLDKPYNPIDFLTWEFGDQDIFTTVRGIQWQSLISLINKQISRPTLQLSQLAPKSKAL